ncbi:hypothetical protein [Deinococcus frigens]|uniref:hypothetical protein n=1 Tax=Deinococcus frigens TaxID=249403 RepID=UPI000A5F9F0E|nr:hypothetical protein [Deinococcus frigens]
MIQTRIELGSQSFTVRAALTPPLSNISQSGLAWASFSWGGKQALPYLWPRVTLGK